MSAVIEKGGIVFSSNDYRDIIKEKVYTLSDIENISLNLKSSNVEFSVSDSNELKIIQYGKIDSEKYKETIEDKSIEINDNPINFAFFNLGNGSRYKVYLPNSYNGNLLVKTVSGEIAIYQINSNKLSIKTTSGDIETKNIVSNYLNIDTVSGEVILGYVSNTVKIKTTSGDVTIDEALITKDSTVSTVSGDVDINMNKKSTCIVKTDTLSGDVDINSNNYNNGRYEFKIKTTSGDIEID
jgi:DUF4097 and DUF4098 domain-containing protein YvlB